MSNKNKITAQARLDNYYYIDKAGHKRRLTNKQRDFINDIIIDTNPTQSIKKHYDVNKTTTASAMAWENLNKPYMRAAVIQAFNASGMSLNKACERVSHWIDSNKHDASLRALNIYGEWNGLKNLTIDQNTTVKIGKEDEEILKKYTTIDLT